MRLVHQILLLIFLQIAVFQNNYAQPFAKHNLTQQHLANRWDEAMPLGNGMLGALIWQKGENLRISLDRADLWDERKALQIEKADFNWVHQQVLKNSYDTVQKWGDEPYGTKPYPTKLPAAALEFNISHLGKVVRNELDLKTAINKIEFSNGAVFTAYIHSNRQQGFFKFENCTTAIENLLPILKPHNYNDSTLAGTNDVVSGSKLQLLKYNKGSINKTTNTVRYRQPTANNKYFEVLVEWKIENNILYGSWSVENSATAKLHLPINSTPQTNGHIKWWHNYWEKSSVQLPDEILEKQYYLEMYKLGAAARANTPAITLQAVWTADNGSLPPWKGDFHNDLNTQLSYWPVYSGNRIEQAESFINWLWKIRAENKKYTKQYFGVDGLNVPGVVTLNGYPMGGWIQYSLSPTVSAWCAQYFYWHWLYTKDKKFLSEKAYPYITESAVYLDNITVLKNGKRYLPLSSTPEYNDNSINAWFTNWTNFDLSLAKFLYKAAAEVAKETGNNAGVQKWNNSLSQLPDFDYNNTGLTIAPGEEQKHSHRHLSNLLAIYPMTQLDIHNAAEKNIIDNSIKHLEKLGTRAWVGYSFTWMASIYARALNGDSAAKQLKIFATNFCSPNSFHLNGDQKGGEYSAATYRPFTLEGNFAFAQGIQEMLLQSKEGYVHLFPAVPLSWKNISFKNLRTEGGFLISAKAGNGRIRHLKVEATAGGELKIKIPENFVAVESNKFKSKGKNLYAVYLKKGESISIEQ